MVESILKNFMNDSDSSESSSDDHVSSQGDTITAIIPSNPNIDPKETGDVAQGII